MQRQVFARLLEWKVKPKRKPLLLRGARQVGKTWLVREFAKTYSSFVEINLEAQPELIPLFDQYKGQPQKLVEQLNLILETKITPKKTLLFIDEIQESPQALMALRYFQEKWPDLDVVAAGSLLEFTLQEISFPVGRIEFLHLFPLNFHEYLLALGADELSAFLQTYDNDLDKAQVSDLLHAKLLTEIKNYCFIGGMPEVVRTYAETKDFQQCFELQGDLINNFRFDFNKYASRSKVPYLRRIFDSVPIQFSKKFVYANVADDIKSRELSEALQLLNSAGLVYYCHHTSGNGVPLSAEVNLKKFKIYFLDIGLAMRSLGFKPRELATTSLADLVKQGGIMEQFVCQELLSQTEKGSVPLIYYWQREALNSSAEVDFLIGVGKQVVPVEVKSGRQRFSKSLGIFMREKNSDLGCYISMDRSKTLSDGDGVRLINFAFYDTAKVLGFF